MKNFSRDFMQLWILTSNFKILESLMGNPHSYLWVAVARYSFSNYLIWRFLQEKKRRKKEITRIATTQNIWLNCNILSYCSSRHHYGHDAILIFGTAYQKSQHKCGIVNPRRLKRVFLTFWANLFVFIKIMARIYPISTWLCSEIFCLTWSI